MGYKVRCGTFSQISVIPQTKLIKNLFTFFFLENPTGEEQNLNEQLVIAHSKSTLVGVRKLCSICNEYRQSDSNAYNCGGLARCCEERAKRKLLHRMHVFLQDPATKFYEVATRLCMEIGYETHDFLQLIYITIIPAVLNLH